MRRKTCVLLLFLASLLGIASPASAAVWTFKSDFGVISPCGGLARRAGYFNFLDVRSYAGAYYQHCLANATLSASDSNLNNDTMVDGISVGGGTTGNPNTTNFAQNFGPSIVMRIYTGTLCSGAMIGVTNIYITSYTRFQSYRSSATSTC